MFKRKNHSEPVPGLPPRQGNEVDEREYDEEESHTTADYASFAPPPVKPRSLWRRILTIGLIILILGALAGGAFWYFSRHKAAKPAPQTSTSNSQFATPAPAASETNGVTKHYVSTRKDLNLEFDYPSAWQVASAQSSGEGSDQPIIISSPSTTFTDASGASATGKVTVLIRPRSAGLSEFSPNSGSAAQDSVQIGYTHPTANQHQYPFLSFVHIAAVTATPRSPATTPTPASPPAPTTSDKTTGFEEVIVTGIQQFKKGIAISNVDLSLLDPIVSASFYRCAAGGCKDKGSGSLSITNETWQNAPLFKQTLDLFQSLKIN